MISLSNYYVSCLTYIWQKILHSKNMAVLNINFWYYILIESHLKNFPRTFLLKKLLYIKFEKVIICFSYQKITCFTKITKWYLHLMIFIDKVSFSFILFLSVDTCWKWESVLGPYLTKLMLSQLIEFSQQFPIVLFVFALH